MWNVINQGCTMKHHRSQHGFRFQWKQHHFVITQHAGQWSFNSWKLKVFLRHEFCVKTKCCSNSSVFLDITVKVRLQLDANPGQMANSLWIIEVAYIYMCVCLWRTARAIVSQKSVYTSYTIITRGSTLQHIASCGHISIVVLLPPVPDVCHQCHWWCSLTHLHTCT